MIPLFKELWHDFWYSKEKARLWLRSALGFFFGVGAQVFAYPIEVVKTWDWKEIIIRLGLAAVPAVALGIGVGEKNLPPINEASK